MNDVSLKTKFSVGMFNKAAIRSFFLLEGVLERALTLCWSDVYNTQVLAYVYAWLGV